MPPLKTNKLTGLVDSEALTNFARSLPKKSEACCSYHLQLARLRGTYLRLARRLAWKETAAWRYQDHLEKYGADGTVIEIHR